MTAPQMEALLDGVARRYHVDPNRVIANVPARSQAEFGASHWL